MLMLYKEYFDDSSLLGIVEFQDFTIYCMLHFASITMKMWGLSLQREKHSC